MMCNTATAVLPILLLTVAPVLAQTPADEKRQGEIADPRAAPNALPPDREGQTMPGTITPTNVGPTNVGPTGRGRIYAEELTDYTVHLADVERFGKVERLVINLESGAIEQLVVTVGGGILGMGSARYEIPFNQVAAINTGSREMRVAINRSQIELPDNTAENEKQ